MTFFSPPAFEAKRCAPEELAHRALALPAPRVFTNGCFDLLHRGHATCLAQARALGASLIVALNSDASVKRLGKGADRPVNSLADRVAVVAALEAVSLVTWFEEDTPLNAILACRPQVLVKGGDWPPEKIVGAREVLSWGGRVYAIPFVHQRSTTALLEKIRAIG
ncbi:MAG: adenylyltransferase/cytidyltransferase family protein [Zoogloeaceae bacterium]|jgi:rfaE bifunctional protein nucleotidyltransferase chain/domain|nr:adenylyltransferase/cytidyltransferase family protein [Zoogloeaceae bacterium]